MWFESRDNRGSGTYQLFIPKILTLWWLGNEHRQDPWETLFLSFTCPTVRKHRPHKDNHTQAHLLFMHVNHALYIQWFPSDLGFSFAREMSMTSNACPGPTSAPAAHNVVSLGCWHGDGAKTPPPHLRPRWEAYALSWAPLPLRSSVRIVTRMQKLCCSRGVGQGRNCSWATHTADKTVLLIMTVPE